MIEYALMLGFLAVAAGAVLPGAASSIGTIFSQVGSVVKAADSSSDEALKQQQPIEVPCASSSQQPESVEAAHACGNAEAAADCCQ